MFVPQIKDATPQVNGQSELRHLFAYSPDSTRHLLMFTQSVMRGGPLPPGECELLAAITSQQNHCGFWIGSHAAVAAQFLGRDVVDRVLERRSLTERERAYWCLVDASHLHDAEGRRTLVETAAEILGPEDFYNALSVVALFNFYNKFVDVAGVAELTEAGYDASGVRLAQHGYAPPSK